MKTPLDGRTDVGTDEALARPGTRRLLAVLLAVAMGLLQVAAPRVLLAADVGELEKALRPGESAMGRVLPGIESLTPSMSREVQNGKADLHVFYAMVIARMLHERCQDLISLMRSAAAQGCPALDAALTQRLGEAAQRLEGTAEVIEGSLPLVRSPRVLLLGKSMTEAVRLYVGPVKEFAARERQDL